MSKAVVCVELSGGHRALVDSDDLERLSAFAWQIARRTTNYAVRSFKRPDGRRAYVYMHREILNLQDPTMVVDHINGEGLDNRRANLRVATRTQNNRNIRVRKDNKSGFKGVFPSGGRWAVQISVKGKREHVGLFDTVEAAARAYDRAAVEQYGAFAKTNVMLGLLPPEVLDAS